MAPVELNCARRNPLNYLSKKYSDIFRIKSFVFQQIAALAESHISTVAFTLPSFQIIKGTVALSGCTRLG
jgi:hypothetical protein